MSTRTNAEALLVWLGDRTGSTISDVVASGLMNGRTASNAIQYALGYGCVERILQAGASAKDPKRYRVTGVPLPGPHVLPDKPSFDALLNAWGIALVPRQLAVVEAHRHECEDD